MYYILYIEYYKDYRDKKLFFSEINSKYPYRLSPDPLESVIFFLGHVTRNLHHQRPKIYTTQKQKSTPPKAKNLHHPKAKIYTTQNTKIYTTQTQKSTPQHLCAFYRFKKSTPPTYKNLHPHVCIL